MDKRNKIEIRSEKVRNIVGKIPPVTLRVGISVISIVITLILILAYFLPYPQYYNTDIEIISTPKYQIVRTPVPGLYFNNSENKSNIGIVISSDSIFHIKSNAQGRIVTNNCDSCYVFQNDIIAAIIPDTTISFSGICKVPANIKNKIRPGQNVIITLYSGEECPASVFNIGNFQQRDSSATYPYYIIHIKLNCQLSGSELSDGKVEGKILISEKPLLQSILHLN